MTERIVVRDPAPTRLVVRPNTSTRLSVRQRGTTGPAGPRGERGSDADVSEHAALVNAHGVTALLIGAETPAGAQEKADAAIAGHDTTVDVHGIADTGALVRTDDVRLSDARLPVAHAATHMGGDDPVTPAGIGAATVAALDGETAARVAADLLLIPLTQKGAPGGVGSLDGAGRLLTSQLPAVAITASHVVDDETAMLALAAQAGDVAIRTDGVGTFILRDGGDPAVLADWLLMRAPTDVVTSVDGRPGAVNLADRYDPLGEADSERAAHENAADPHPGYLTPAEGNAAYDPLGAATASTATHNAATTGVHGIANTAALVRTDDPRLAAHPHAPAAHAASHTTAGSDPMNAGMIGAASATHTHPMDATWLRHLWLNFAPLTHFRWGTVMFANSLVGGASLMSEGPVGAWVEARVFLRGGTYRVHLYHHGGAAYGIIRVLLGGAPIGDIDTYSVTRFTNRVTIISNIGLGGDGERVVRLEVVGQNILATSATGEASLIVFERQS